jgi:hypothetical protein
MTDVRVDASDRRDPTRPLEPDASLGELFSQLTKDFSSLVSTQVELAKVEIKEELTHAGKGAGMLTGGLLAAYLALILLSFATAWGLAAVMPDGFAFLIVSVVWTAIAAMLATAGRKELRAVHPVPPQSKQALEEDIQWARRQKH